MYTISLCIYADSRMIGPPRTPALGYEFLNKKLIRGSRRMDAVAAKSDALTAWKCTATDAYWRLQTLTDAYRRWFPVRGFCSFRVWPCQSVPQCDWALRGGSESQWRMQGVQRAPPPPSPKSPKLAKIYQKNAGGRPPKPRAPPFLQILDPPWIVWNIVISLPLIKAVLVNCFALLVLNIKK